MGSLAGSAKPNLPNYALFPLPYQGRGRGRGALGDFDAALVIPEDHVDRVVMYPAASL